MKVSKHSPVALMALASAISLSIALSQEAPLAPRPGALAPAQDQGSGPQAAPQLEGPLKIEGDLRAQLTLADLDAREAAFDGIVKRAASMPDVRNALEALSKDAAEPDLAFTARLALRDVHRVSRRRGSWGQPGPALPAPFGRGGVQAPFPRLHMDFDFGSLFEGDPFFEKLVDESLHWGGSGPGKDPFFEVFGPFGGAQGGLPFGPWGPAFDFNGPGGWDGTMRFSMRQTADGVEIELTEDKGKGPETKTYSAPSLEELLKAHPELKDYVR